MVSLTGKADEKQFQFLFGVQCLHTVFRKKPDLFFYYIRMMIDKYAFTDIRLDEALSTAQELHSDPEIIREVGKGPENLPLEAITLWPGFRFYNASVSAIPISVTNRISKKKVVIEEKKLVTVGHNFPIPINVQLVIEDDKSIVTNKFRMNKEDATNLVLSGKTRSLVLNTDLEPLEDNLYDNRVQFTGTDRLSLYGDILTHYYAGRKSMIPNEFRFAKSDKLPDGWRNMDEDKEKSLDMKADIRFVVDSISENDSELYLLAYKMVNNKPFSYVVVRGQKSKDGIEFSSIIDPLL